MDVAAVQHKKQSNYHRRRPTQMNKQIAIVRVTSVFGNKTIYPVNDAAVVFARIAGTKTLTMPTVNKMKQLGYEVLVQKESL